MLVLDEKQRAKNEAGKEEGKRKKRGRDEDEAQILVTALRTACRALSQVAGSVPDFVSSENQCPWLLIW